MEPLYNGLTINWCPWGEFAQISRVISPYTYNWLLGIPYVWLKRFHSTWKITAKGEPKTKTHLLGPPCTDMSTVNASVPTQKSEAALTFAQAEVFLGREWIRFPSWVMVPRNQPVVYMDVSERMVGFSPQIIPLKNRGFSIITHHPFWGISPLFLETPIYRSSVPSKLPGFQSYMAEVLGPTGS